MLVTWFTPQRADALTLTIPKDPINSIESTVVAADVIVRASLVQSNVRDAFPLWRSAGLFSSTFPSKKSVYVCKLNVTEVLKGPPELANAKGLVFACESKPGETKDSIFCLVSAAHYFAVKAATTQQSGAFANEAWVLDQGRGETFIIPIDAASRVFDSAGHAIKGTDAILSAVRREAQHPLVEQFGSLYLQFSGTSEYFYDPFGPEQGLKILADRRTEGRARQWIKSKDPGDRWNAVNVLKQFRSPENIALLQGLLSDQTSGYFLGDPSFSGWAYTAAGKWHGEAYTIRRAAWDALNHWGTSAYRAGGSSQICCPICQHLASRRVGALDPGHFTGDGHPRLAQTRTIARGASCFEFLPLRSGGRAVAVEPMAHRRSDSRQSSQLRSKRNRRAGWPPAMAQDRAVDRSCTREHQCRSAHG